jgi:hypothetical protein
MSKDKTCGDCKWFLSGKVFGLCECPLPMWAEAASDYIEPDDIQARYCACFEKKED